MVVKKDGVKLLQNGVDRETDRYFVLLEVIHNGVELQCIAECRDVNNLYAEDYTIQFVNPSDMSPVLVKYNTTVFDDIEQEALMAFEEMKDSFDVQTG